MGSLLEGARLIDNLYIFIYFSSAREDQPVGTQE